MSCRYQVGWHLSSSKAFLLYYHTATDDALGYLAQVPMGYGEKCFMTILNSSSTKMKLHGYKIVKLNEYFADFVNPTEAEIVLFEVDYGIPYITDRYLKDSGMSEKEYWFGSL